MECGIMLKGLELNCNIKTKVQELYKLNHLNQYDEFSCTTSDSKKCEYVDYKAFSGSLVSSDTGREVSGM
jgi:hypothetical protein